MYRFNIYTYDTNTTHDFEIVLIWKKIFGKAPIIFMLKIILFNNIFNQRSERVLLLLIYKNISVVVFAYFIVQIMNKEKNTTTIYS